jgi:hypothetical protein
MPIDVICSRCGGTGNLEFLHFDPPRWEKETHSQCRGTGKIKALTFEERRRQVQDLQGAEESLQAVQEAPGDRGPTSPPR